MSKWHVGASTRFSIDFVRKTDLLWEALCTQNMLNTMVFIRFHVYRRIDVWVFRGSFLESFCEVFGDLGVALSGLGGYRNVVENWSKFRGFLRGPQILGPYPVEGKNVSRKVSSLLKDILAVKYKLQGCKLSTCKMRRT